MPDDTYRSLFSSHQRHQIISKQVSKRYEQLEQNAEVDGKPLCQYGTDFSAAIQDFRGESLVFVSEAAILH
jgi:hypothetical protein